MIQRNRQSNIELLRIVVMYMVLLLHANILTFGWHQGDALSKLFRFTFESITIVSVNIFVLITGYFGTSFNLSKIANLVYQTIFTVVAITLVLILFKFFSFNSWKELIHGFYFWNYWFINSYIALIILSPLPYLAITHLNQKTLKILLLALFILFCVLGGDFFISPPGIGVDSGYSIIWFVFLYLLGRYIAKYHLPSVRIVKLLLIYFFWFGGFHCIDVAMS